MKEAINKVKAAIAPKDIASHLSHYLVKDGFIHASDNRLVAAAPFPLVGEFLVPGGDFEAVADRFSEKTKLEVTPTTVIFRDGKMKATLKTLPIDTVNYQKPEGEQQKIPKDFLQALARIRPFISDNAVHFWALAVCLEKDFIYATNNIVVAAAECKGLNGGGKLLPSWAVDYLLSRNEELEAIISDKVSMTFLWWDGSWMKTQLVDSEFPKGAENLIEKMAKPTFRLTPEWKLIYGTISEMTDALIEIFKDKIVGVTEHGEIEVEVSSAAPEGASKWHKKFLDPVIAAAEFWQPDVWPKPSPFIGPGIRGLIVGRN